MDRNDAVEQHARQLDALVIPKARKDRHEKKKLADDKVASPEQYIRRTLSQRYADVSFFEVQIRGKLFAKFPNGYFGNHNGKPLGKVKDGRFYRGGIVTLDEAKLIRDLAIAEARGNPAAIVSLVPLDMRLCDQFDADGRTVVAEGLLGMYIRQNKNPLSDNIISRLTFLQKHEVFKNAKLADVGEDLLRDYCEQRKNKQVAVTSNYTDYSHIARAITVVSQWKKWKNWEPLKDVRKMLREEGLIGESSSDKFSRKRVPLLPELKVIVPWYEARDQKIRDAKAAKAALIAAGTFNEKEGHGHGTLVNAHEQAINLKFNLKQGMRIGEQLEIELRHLKEHEDGSATLGLWRKDSDGVMQKDSNTRRRWVPAMPLTYDAYELLKQTPAYIEWKKLTPAERAVSTLRPFPFNYKYVNNVWLQCLQECGITDLHWHDNRARAATELLKIMPAHEVMRFTGHRTLKALQIYVRIAEEEMAGLAQKTKDMRPIY